MFFLTGVLRTVHPCAQFYFAVGDGLHPLAKEFMLAGWPRFFTPTNATDATFVGAVFFSVQVNHRRPTESGALLKTVTWAAQTATAVNETELGTKKCSEDALIFVRDLHRLLDQGWGQ